MKRGTSIAAVWGLVFYLTLFSGVALLHAYAEDELVDPHGCVIGAWVQQANAPDSSQSPLAPLPCLVGFLEFSSDTTIPKAFSSATSRGPPSRSS
jgi:hypothetical protein